MSFLNDLLGRKDPNHVMQPLYNAVIAQGRRVDWYEQGSVLRVEPNGMALESL